MIDHKKFLQLFANPPNPLSRVQLFGKTENDDHAKKPKSELKVIEHGPTKLTIIINPGKRSLVPEIKLHFPSCASGRHHFHHPEAEN